MNEKTCHKHISLSENNFLHLFYKVDTLVNNSWKCEDSYLRY